MLVNAVDQLAGESPASPVTINTTAAQLLGANQNRQGLFLESDPTANAGGTVIYILFGTGTPSAANYHIALPPGASAGWGVLGTSDGIWRGPIQAVGSAAGLKLAVAVA
jgi:hypothetical protein